MASRCAPAAILVLAALSGGCGVAMKQKLGGQPIDPAVVISDLRGLEKSLDTNKQIFRLRLLDKGRTFSGDGAMFYREPDTLHMSIYGPPFTTLWMQMLVRGDSIVVVLPKESRVVRTVRGDTDPLNRLSSSEGLTDGEFLGGVTGIFHLDRFRSPEMTEQAAVEGSIRRLRLIGNPDTYEFAYDIGLGAVVEFLHFTGGKLNRRIDRSEFREVDGFRRASKMVYRDYLEDREITVLVNKEEVNRELSDKAFEITLPAEAR